MTQRRFLCAEWRNLVILNYAIDPALLTARVPAGTELDRWDGTTFVSVVGFQFLDTRVRGVPIPFHRNFEEVNLRFYVRRKAEGVWRRGVVFVKELVPRRAIAWVARWAYGENYVALPMRHSISGDSSQEMTLRYQWRSRAGARAEEWEGLWATVSGPATRPSEDSEESFIAEHYWGYARRSDGGALEYQVEHVPWRVWRADVAALECDVAALYGDEFRESLGSTPQTAFVAEGSSVVVRKGCALGQSPR